MRFALSASLALVTLTAMPAWAADAILSGAVTSAAGEKMGGVTVSAKADGSTITTTVYTDESGNYYFPPLPAGHYRVWAEAISFATAKAQVDLSANKAQSFTLSPLSDYFRQLPGDAVITVTSTASNVPIKLNLGSGSDTIRVQSTDSSVTVHEGTGTYAITLGDRAIRRLNSDRV